MVSSIQITQRPLINLHKHRPIPRLPPLPNRLKQPHHPNPPVLLLRPDDLQCNTNRPANNVLKRIEPKPG